MKKGQYILLAIFLIVGCSTAIDSSILGKWRVEDNFHKAIYQIVEQDGALRGEVVFYDDGTTLIDKNSKETHYVFQGLKRDDDRYVDAISGATAKGGESPTVELKLIAKDTLEVINYIHQKAVKQIWTRIKE